MMDLQEVVPLVIGAIVLSVGWNSHLRRDGGTAYRMLVAAFLLLLTAWLATLAEEVAFAVFFNALEHFTGMLAAGLVALACWRLARGGTTEDP